MTRLKEMFLLFVGGLAIGFVVVATINFARARDLGQYAQATPEIRQWFNTLHNRNKNLCCADADGFDAVWDTEADHYRVMQNGRWFVVPDEAVVDVPNKVGVAKVWWGSNNVGERFIRCFMPGTEA